MLVTHSLLLYEIDHFCSFCSNYLKNIILGGIELLQAERIGLQVGL